MGKLITINSATMVNKGLEIIEASLLFDIPIQNIEVVLHPQAVVHAMVEYTDGSTIAQISLPDMRLALSMGLRWPNRLPDAIHPYDWGRGSTWEFLPWDEELFPAVRLAREVGTVGGALPAVYNAANEVCVASFLDGLLSFVDIVKTVNQVVAWYTDTWGYTGGAAGHSLTLSDVMAAEESARGHARRLIERRTTAH
jgi:1-deoxy-D-xylulose-5-phosphate reductoisomerase